MPEEMNFKDWIVGYLGLIYLLKESRYMPIYNYKCEKCGVDLEIIHKITETPEIKCEFCGGKKKKIFHPV